MGVSQYFIEADLGRKFSLIESRTHYKLQIPDLKYFRCKVGHKLSIYRISGDTVISGLF